MTDHANWNEFRTAHDVARGLNWVGWKTKGKAQLLIAIGPASVAVARGEKVDPENAIAMLYEELETITRLLRELGANKQTHGAAPRPEGREH